MAYTYYRTITVDHTKCGSSDSTNFPVCFSSTSTAFKTVANSGHVNNTVAAPVVTGPADLVFSPNADGSSPYKWEVESYDATTGALVAWIKIPTLSASSDTVIYISYGDASVTTFQGGSAGDAWNSNFKGVYHLNGATPSVADSTANAFNGSNNGATAGTGKVDGGAVFNGSTQWVSMASATMGFLQTAPFSGACWIKTSADGRLITNWNFNTSAGWSFAVGDDGAGGILSASLSNSSGANHRVAQGTATVSDNAFHRVWFTYAGASAAAGFKFYVDGAVDAATVLFDTDPGSLVDGSLRLGQVAGIQFFAGTMDEVYLLNNAVGADWILTDYNNQSSPSTFYTLGSELTGGVSLTGAAFSFGGVGNLRFGPRPG